MTMKKERRPRPPRKMKPVFLVFCEGDTEETYINFLRQKYRLPIKVIPRITGIAISPDIVRRYIQAEKISPDDKMLTSFMMYDLDRSETAAKIALCKGSINISSNPCLELWFLLHNAIQTAAISTTDCIDKLRKSRPDWANYKKGSFSEKQKAVLWENREAATTRAKQLPEEGNPSSLVYRLIDAMDKAKGYYSSRATFQED
jgi:hypothetical protein